MRIGRCGTAAGLRGGCGAAAAARRLWGGCGVAGGGCGAAVGLRGGCGAAARRRGGCCGVAAGQLWGGCRVASPPAERPAADEDAFLAAAAQRARQTTAPGRGSGRGRRGRGRGRGTAAPPDDLPPPDPQPPPTRRGQANATAEAGMRHGFASLDAVNLQACCRQRVLTLQSAPARIRGALRTALRTGLRLAVHPVAPEDAARGWKLFCLAPRMLLFRLPGESRTQSAELDRRCELFRAGHWSDLRRCALRSA